MCLRTLSIAVLCLLSLLALSACASLDAGAEESDLTVQWCPASGEVIWSLEFGGVLEAEEPVPWTGDYGYSLVGGRSGVGGGRGSSHGRGGHVDTASRYRLSETVILGGRPQSLRVTVGGTHGPEVSGWTLSMERRFRLSSPTLSPEQGCVFMDVHELTKPTG